MIKISIVEIKLFKVMWQRPRGKRPGEQLMKGLKIEGAKYQGQKLFALISSNIRIEDRDTSLWYSLLSYSV